MAEDTKKTDAPAKPSKKQLEVERAYAVQAKYFDSLKKEVDWYRSQQAQHEHQIEQVVNERKRAENLVKDKEYEISKLHDEIKELKSKAASLKDTLVSERKKVSAMNEKVEIYRARLESGY